MRIMRVHAFIAAVAALLLIGISNAQNIAPCSSSSAITLPGPILPGSWYCNFVQPAVHASWSTWGPVALAAVLASFSIATLIFIVGFVLKNEKIRTFGVGEIYEALASLIIVALFLFVAGVLFGLIPGLFIPYNPYNVSLTQINNTIGSTDNFFSSLFFGQMTAYYYATLDLRICTAGNCTDLNNYYGPIIMIVFVLPAQALVMILIDALLILNSEFYLILFFMYAGIPVFLVPGVIFRTFLPTRALGGMMIAVAISFYMLMPMLFGIAYTLTSNNVLGTIQQLTGSVTAQTQGSGSQTNSLSATSPLAQTLSDANQAMGAFWLDVAFYPAMILAVCYAFAVTLADFIGGMSSSSSRMRLLV